MTFGTRRTSLGFSHHADIIVRKSNGKTVVESIDKVHSVDLVNVPATTKGVFESEADSMLTLKQNDRRGGTQVANRFRGHDERRRDVARYAGRAPEGPGPTQIKAAFVRPRLRRR